MATINLGSIKFNWKGTYAGGTAYVVDDVVEYNGSSYICILASTGNLPTNATYFEQMSSAGTDGTDFGTILTTQGDIVYRDASGIARLGAGTAGQVLQSGGTGANVSWTDQSGGALVLLNSTKVSGSSVANITFNSSVLDTSTYSKFKFFIQVYGVNTAPDKLYCYPSTDNGSNYNLNAFSAGVGAYVRENGTNDGDYRTSMFETGNNRWMIGNALDGSSASDTGAWQGEAMLMNTETSSYSQSSHFIWQGGRYYNAGGSNEHVMYQAGHGMACRLSTGAKVNNVKFLFGSGNIQVDSRITVFGVKES